MQSSPQQPSVCLAKSGWLEKFSVGRGLFHFKNWQRRYVSATHAGLNYSSSMNTSGEARTFIPFTAINASELNGNGATHHRRHNSSSIANGGGGGSAGGRDGELSSSSDEVTLHPVFLIPDVPTASHPEAKDRTAYAYFGIRFQEKGTARVLLFRTTSFAERQQWVRFLSQFIHVGSITREGFVPGHHPLVAQGHGVEDDEELGPLEKRQLRRQVVDWDEGIAYRWHEPEGETQSSPAGSSDDDPAVLWGDPQDVAVVSARREGDTEQPPTVSTPPPPAEDADDVL